MRKVALRSLRITARVAGYCSRCWRACSPTGCRRYSRHKGRWR